MTLGPNRQHRDLLFLPEAVMVEAVSVEPDESWLLPPEHDQIRRAVESRRRDFILGRHCARLAMAELGMAPVSIGIGNRGEPLWPAGIVGTITHTNGFAASAVARRGDFVSLGLDVELNDPLPENVFGRVARPEELARVEAMSGADGLAVDRLLFSSKEAVYKTWYPVAKEWLGFEDVSVSLDPPTNGSGRFRADVLVDGPIRSLDGRYLYDEQFLLTAIGLPSSP